MTTTTPQGALFKVIPIIRHKVQYIHVVGIGFQQHTHTINWRQTATILYCTYCSSRAYMGFTCKNNVHSSIHTRTTLRIPVYPHHITSHIIPTDALNLIINNPAFF